ncbi:MAG: HEAT repeat domain-containing protein [Acidobacteriota bacterium]|nr:HEAT repeat domain-containing protein [Acidobacteriota bacterium]
MRPRVFRRNPSALSLILVIVLAPTSFGRPAPDFNESSQVQRQGRSFPPTQYIPSHDYDTKHIALDLRFDWEKQQAIGTETIDLSPLARNLKHVLLDAAFMNFASIKLPSGTSLQYKFDEMNQKLDISLDRAYQPDDEIRLVISYNTVQPPSGTRSLNGGGGLNFIKPTPEDPTRPRQIWSQGESEYNHYWFPCFDHPNDFFTSEVYATVEKPLSVVSNGKLLDTRENADGTRTFHWKIAAPHAAYLSSIIVGDYAPVVGEYDGIPVITNVYPNELEQGKITAKRLPDMVKFFSEKTGVKYPYEKYAQTVARDFNGGMENISATTQYDLMIHDARTEIDQTSDSIQSHELAHQWFGDYLTCRNWSDIWLNESFATYFQAMWDEQSLGHDDFLYLDVKGNQDQYYGTWAQGRRRPIVTRNYANPDAVFDTYAYPRGGAVLHMLRTYLGEDNWWRAINHYLTKYAHQPVETAEFRIAIEEATGQPMDWFFDEWLYKMGHPVFRVTQNYDAATKALKLSVKQEQKPDPDSQYPQVAFFETPVDIEIGTASGARVERIRIEPQEEQSFNFPVDSQPLLVNFDYGDTLIKELHFEKTIEQLAYQLARDTDVLGRVWALEELTAKVKDKSSSDADKQHIAGQLASALTSDKFWGVRLEAATALNNTPGDAVRTALLAATKDPKPRVRARVIKSLASTKDTSLASVYLPFLNDQSYAVIAEAARALGQTKSPVAYDALVKLVDTPSWRDNIRAAALTGLAATGDKRALELGFRYVAVGNSQAVRAAALGILGATGKDDPRTFPLLSDMFKQAFARGQFGLIFAAAEALVTLGDQRGLAAFEEVGKQAGNPQIQGFLMQFAGRLRQAAVPTPSPTPQP